MCKCENKEGFSYCRNRLYIFGTNTNQSNGVGAKPNNSCSFAENTYPPTRKHTCKITKFISKLHSLRKCRNIKCLIKLSS